MVRDCDTPSPSVNAVRSHYGYVPEVVGEEPVGPDVPTETTADISPPYDPESYQHMGGEKCYIVHGQKMPLTEQAVDYYRNIGVTVTKC